MKNNVPKMEDDPVLFIETMFRVSLLDCQKELVRKTAEEVWNPSTRPVELAESHVPVDNGTVKNCEETTSDIKRPKSFIETNAEKAGYEGRSYMAGFYDALSVEEDQKKTGIFDTPINIIPLDCTGVIIGIFLGRSYGIEYKVRYYLDGKQYDNYFFEHEVKGL